MTEIKTVGLKGVYNRIAVFSHMIQNDVYDVTARMDYAGSGSRLTANRVMLVSRTQKLINTGEDQNTLEYLAVLFDHFGRISSREELQSFRQHYRPEFNMVTNNIGKGYRGVANRTMLVTRANFHIDTGQDIMPYEYIEIIKNNGAIKI